MAATGFFDRDEEADDQASYSRKLSSPMSYVWTMAIFLILAGFTGAILFRQAREAFVSNPGLNGLILGVATIGILLAFNHVLALRPEVRWFNSFRAAGSAEKAGRQPSPVVIIAVLVAVLAAIAAVAIKLRRDD